MTNKFNISALFLLISVLLVGCGSSDEVRWVKPPQLQLDPNGRTPLGLEINFESAEPVQLTVEAVAGAANEKSFRYTYQGFFSGFSQPLLGLKPDTTYNFKLHVKRESGETVILDDLESITTAPLPDDFPAIKKTMINKKAIKGSATLVMPGVPQRDKTMGQYAVLLDGDLDVIWYYKYAARDLNAISPFRNFSFDIEQLSNGRLLVDEVQTIFEMDYTGNIYNAWHTEFLEGKREELPDLDQWLSENQSIKMKIDHYHHDHGMLPNGNLYFASEKSVLIENFPQSTSDRNLPPKKAVVAEAYIYEVDSKTGDLLNEWGMREVLSSLKMGYDSLVKSHFVRGYDWNHINSVEYDAESDAYLVSLPHQDAVIKFSRQTGELIWILGNHHDWDEVDSKYLLEPVGELEWLFHQHAIMVMPDNNIMVYDNGSYKAPAYTPIKPMDQIYSRAVQYAVDEDAKSVSQSWDSTIALGKQMYVPVGSDADYVAKSNSVLITNMIDNFFNQDFISIRGKAGLHKIAKGGRVIEIDKKTNEIIMDFSTPNHAMYRGDRVHDLPLLH